MRVNITSLIALVLFGITMSCVDKNKQIQEKEVHKVQNNISKVCQPHILKNKQNNLNISVLLDLSDRIENSNQIHKDSSYLSSLAKTFLTHVKTKKLLFLEDRLQLFFNPEPEEKEIYELAKKLGIVFTRQTSKDRIEETQTIYNELPSKLYHLAVAEAKANKGYPGSDIWGFFKNHIQDYCIDDCHRNVLVVLTDGYIYYDKTIMKNKERTSFLTPKSLSQLQLNTPKWQDILNSKDLGFIPANKELKDLEVLIIGIDSQNIHPYAQEIIQTYWHNWLIEMGVKEDNIKIKSADIPSGIEKVINDFILKKS